MPDVKGSQLDLVVVVVPVAWLHISWGLLILSRLNTDCSLSVFLIRNVSVLPILILTFVSVDAENVLSTFAKSTDARALCVLERMEHLRQRV